MKCPKDASNTRGNQCREVSLNYGCTRPINHKGKHHAHGLSECYHIWEVRE